MSFGVHFFINTTSPTCISGSILPEAIETGFIGNKPSANHIANTTTTTTGIAFLGSDLSKSSFDLYMLFLVFILKKYILWP